MEGVISKWDDENNIDCVAPNTDAFSIARNAFALLDRRQPQRSLDLLSKIDEMSPFTDLAKSFAIRDCGNDDKLAEESVVTAIRECPEFYTSLIPWIAKETPVCRDGPNSLPIRIAITLRVFSRLELKGWAVRQAARAGILLPSGAKPLLGIAPETTLCGEETICMIEGIKVKNLKLHLRKFNMSPMSYREFFNLDLSYPI